MARYVETICYLYKKDESFRKAFGESKGVCMRHYPLLLRGAGQHLSGTVQLDFLTALLDVQERNLARMEHDLEWFTLKFDYRNQDKPWGREPRRGRALSQQAAGPRHRPDDAPAK